VRDPVSSGAMFEGFERRIVNVAGVDIACVMGGAGPAVLLLHGFPQTLAMWQQVAPMLEGRYNRRLRRFARLRRFGQTQVHADRSNYSFRAFAADQIGSCDNSGFARFHLIGHDRGGRTAHRMALDIRGRSAPDL